MNEEFSEQRMRLIQDLADKADPFTKKRLLDLAKRYNYVRREPFRSIPHPTAHRNQLTDPEHSG
jgi:hypothetical protein